NAAAAELMQAQAEHWLTLRRELAAEKIIVVEAGAVRKSERERLEAVFLEQLFPVLTPLAIDPAHPFPSSPTFGFSLALKLHRRADGRALYALVPLPSQVDRFWRLNERAGRGGERRFIALESVLSLFLDHLFPGCDVEAQGVFRVLRDS